MQEPKTLPVFASVSLRRGWVFLGCALVAMAISLGLFFVYVPLVVAGLVCAANAISKGRIVPGVLLVSVLILAPISTWFVLLSVRSDNALKSFMQRQHEVHPPRSPPTP
jgi:hypothetical protein